MSAGPIQRERDGHTVPLVSTTAKDRVCHTGEKQGRGYCGRSNAKTTTIWGEVVCADCAAARRADLAAKAERS